MGMVAELLKDIPTPRVVPIRQVFDDTHIPAADIPAAVREQLSRKEILESFPEKGEIAITVGSRGVANVAIITKAIADFVKERGLTPFIVPAMGSHGGSLAEGQRRIIEDYGVTEESAGCEIRSSMETVEIGKTETGQPVRIDKNAYEADGIIVCNRIKPHTAFRGPYESGLMKMMTIGLGKQYGASIAHADGFGKMGENVPLYGKAILKHAPVIFGLGLLENAYDKTREIVALTPQEIIDEEPKLLLKAKSYMPRILFDSCDVLIVDQIGKNISGDGMDPNISGRFPTEFATGGIDAQRVAALDLTDETHGNANGMGLADITTRRLFNKVDFEETYPNSITNRLTGILKIPMIMETDKMAVQLAIRTCLGIDEEKPRLIRIENTMKMEKIYISEAMLEEARRNPAIEILGEPAPMAFDENGNLF